MNRIKAYKQNYSQPEAPQGLVTSKGFMDNLEIEARKSASRSLSSMSFPGGASDDAHAITKHDVLIARRVPHDGINNPGSALMNHPNTQLLSSFSGMNMEGKTSDQVQREVYAAGISVTEQRYGDQKGDSGIAFVIGGAYSVRNTGSYVIHPGQLVQARVPRVSKAPNGQVIDLSEKVPHKRNTSYPQDKHPWVLEPFDPLDFTPQLETLATQVVRPKQSGGVSDASLTEFLSRPGQFRELPSDQSSAFAMKFGVAYIYAQMRLANGTALGDVNRELQELGFIDSPTGLTDTGKDAMRRVFGVHNPKVSDRAATVQDISTASGNGNLELASLLANGLKMLFGGVCDEVHEKQGRCIGKAYTSGGPGELFGLVWGATH